MTAAEARPLIELRNLTRRYPEGGQEHVVLEAVDASIQAGEFVALLGRSGSGKSTLLNLIGGIDTPTSGEVFIGGTSIHRLSEKERTLFRREHIGLVFQFFNLIPTLTVEENLRLPLELTGVPRPRATETAERLLEEVELLDRRRSFPDRLSGGEQQRVAVARALAPDPMLVLADEPTGNLDAETGRRVLELLDRMIRQRGKTIIMATHSREIASHADRLLTIVDHGLVEAR